MSNTTKNAHLDVQHDDLLSTNSMLESMEQVAASLRNVKKARAYVRKATTAYKAGRIDAIRYVNALNEAKAVMARAFGVAAEHGFVCGQGDEMGWDQRAELHANDLINAK